MITKKQEDFVWGALLGGAIGAAAALFFTPYSGAEIRKQMLNGFSRLNGKSIRKAAIATRAKTQTTKTKKMAHARPTGKQNKPR